MSRSSRRRHRASQPDAAAPAAPSLLPSAYSSFDGANTSPNRGYIYFPNLDTRREIDTYTHWELTKKARWFYANSGFARRAVNGTGQMVGYQIPRAMTNDAEWNKLAEDNFERRAGSATVCDLSGKHNFYSIQPKLISRMILDGDVLVALAKTSSGGAAFMVYEGQQIGNDSRTDAERWVNGVLTNSFGRHIAYRILNGDNHFDLPATAACYVADFERIHQVRGLTGFAHAINHLHDRTDIAREIKLGAKIANTFGFYRTRPGDAPRPSGMNPRTRVAAPTSSGTDKIDIEEVTRGGKVAELSNGEELKLLLDSRPHPNLMAFDDSLVRDMSWGFGLSPEVLWFVGKINGTSNRYLLADAVKWVEQKQQLLVDTFLTRYWTYHIACEIERGALRPCEDPEWWKVSWIAQPKITVDRGRDGKLNIDMRKSGMFTLKRHYAEQFSEDWKPNVDDWAAELGYQRERLIAAGFTPEQAVAMLATGASLPGNVLDPSLNSAGDPSALLDPALTE